jgi:hypothetical protein
MKKIRFVGHVSKQGKKRIIIIPLKHHEQADEFKDDDLTIEIYRTFEEDEEK